MIYKEKECKSALNKIKKPMLPYHYDLNIYRGCEHGCEYCFAMYTHAYLDEPEYFKTIYYKKNIVEVLEKELASPKWKKEVINIGGITDAYQPIEKKLGLTREVLKLMVKYKNPIIISTKSDLILRDIDLIKELSEEVCVNIACTITEMDETIRQKIEPGAVSSLRRFKALKRIKEETNAVVGVHLMPAIPFLSCSPSNLKEIYRLAKKVNANYILPGTLYLRGKTRQNFLDFFRKNYPQFYPSLQKIYNNKEVKLEFKKKFHTIIHDLEKEYGITSNYKKEIEQKIEEISKRKKEV